MERGSVHKARFAVPVDRDHVAKDWATRGYGCGGGASWTRPGGNGTGSCTTRTSW